MSATSLTKAIADVKSRSLYVLVIASPSRLHPGRSVSRSVGSIDSSSVQAPVTVPITAVTLIRQERQLPPALALPPSASSRRLRRRTRSAHGLYLRPARGRRARLGMLDAVRTADASFQDWSETWPILRQVAQAGETFCWPRDISEDQARAYWMQPPAEPDPRPARRRCRRRHGHAPPQPCRPGHARGECQLRRRPPVPWPRRWPPTGRGHARPRSSAPSRGNAPTRPAPKADRRRRTQRLPDPR